MVNRRVSVAVDADLNAYNRGVMSGVASTKAWVRELESADSRLSGIVQTGLALAPALTPLSAAAVGPIAGLTTQLGFLAVAGGTTMLAFQGVGDALGALNDYQLEQTPEKLEKLNEAMDALGPAGQIFVRRLQELRGELQGLQDIAQADMLPGVSEGIDAALTHMPRLERVISSVASAVGDLFEDSGNDLAGPEWTEFFEYLEREAGPILEATGHTLGNLVEGITNLVMAADPLSDDFTSGLLDASEAFVEWSDNLDSSQGFQEFVAYVQESGPQAMDTLGSLAGMLLEFAEAAAPVGDAVLPVLEVLDDVLGEVADSPAGPVIIGAAAAVGVLGRSLALLSAVGLRGGGDSIFGKIFAADKIKAGVAAMKLGQQSLYNVTTAAERAEMSETALVAAKERQTAAEKKRTAAMKDGAVQLGKNAVALGGMAIMASGAADGLGLTNTTSMAMMGTLAGPWGAAVGGGVGLLMDFAKAGELADSMQTQLSASVRAAGTDFVALDAAVDAGAERLRNYWDEQSLLGASFEGWDKLLTGASAYDAAVTAQIEARRAAIDDMGNMVPIATALGETGSLNLEELTRVAERAAPAMRDLGVSFDDLRDMDSEELDAVADAVAKWLVEADSAPARTKAVAQSFRALDDQMLDTATSAEMVSASLDALLDPNMDLSAATDNWIASLRDLEDELSDNSRTLKGNSDAALENRAAIRDRVSNLKDVLVAEANAGAGAKELSARLRNQREALLDAGEAAGVSRKQMNGYLDQLGLTPKLVRTLMKLEAQEAENKAERIRERLVKLAGMKPSPEVDAKVAAAEAALARVQADLDRLNGKTSTSYVRIHTIRTGPGGQGGGYGPSALGNIFPSVQSFAYGGDYPNQHQPEFARRPGAVPRVWMEEETEGETYIPHANDHRRPRAKSILEDTASMFGGEVLWYATGGSSDDDQKKKKKRKFAVQQDDEYEDTAGIVRIAQMQAELLQSGLAASLAQEDAALQQSYAAEVALTAAEDQAKAAEDNMQSAESILAASQQLRDSLAESIASQFSGSLTGGGLAGLSQTLDRDINAGGSMDTTLQALIAAGLDTTGPGAGLLAELAASEDQRTANELLAAGPEAIAEMERKFIERQQINDSRGATVADAMYSQRIAVDTAAVAVAEQQLAVAQAALTQAETRATELGNKLDAQRTATENLAGQLTEALNSIVKPGRR